MGKLLLASIHDVGPRFESEVDQLADLLGGVLGGPKFAMLVVPDHWGVAPLGQAPAFRARLRRWADQGVEMFVHGWYHKDLAEHTGVTGFKARHLTAGEGEFLDPDKPAALDLLLRGRTAVEACGVKVAGFIAPAWLLGAEAERAVCEAGFQYTTRIATVSDFVTGAVHRSRSQVWSVRAGWRRACSLAWNSLLFQMCHGCPLTRIGIHPPDWEHPQIRNQILRIIGMALAAREPMTYEGWLSRIRAEQ